MRIRRLLVAALGLVAIQGTTGFAQRNGIVSSSSAATSSGTAIGHTVAGGRVSAPIAQLTPEQAASRERAMIRPKLRAPAGASPLAVPAPSAPETHSQTPRALAAPQAATDFIFQRVHDLSASEAPNWSVVGESSLANMGDTVFYAANWFASRSTNGGLSFSAVDPFTLFPSVDGGFCCDQVVQYAPNQDMVVWALLYTKSATNGTLRIATAVGNDVAINNWTWYDFDPPKFGFPSGNWMDFPNLTVAGNYLYVTANVYTTAGNNFTGTVLMRILLSQFLSGKVDYTYYATADVDSLRCTEGAGTTIYCGTHSPFGNNILRIIHWDESSTTIAIDDVQLSPFTYITDANAAIAKTPDGVNWAGRLDSRVLGAWAAGGVVGFMFCARQDATFPYPYTIVARFNQSTRALISQTPIWSSTFAWIYPSVSVNASGNLAGTLAFGGGTLFPNSAVWISDDIQNGFSPLATYTAATSNISPGINVWGDFFSTRRHKTNVNTWVAGTYYLNGASKNFVVQRYMWFGRQRDFVATIPVTVQTSPSGRSFTVDGTTYTATQVFNWTPGSSHTIATTSPQDGGGGTQYVWNTWSDSGAISHIVSPSTTTTYTANFTTQFLLTMSAGTGGTVSPASGYRDQGSAVTISATANSGFNFSSWTGTGAGSFSGTTVSSSVTMNGPISETAGFTPVTQPSALQFVPVTPCRIMDTRPQSGFTGAFGPPSFAASSTRVIPIPTGACGIPSTAKAYSLNITAVPSEPTLAFLTAYPAGQSLPNVSTLNSPNGLIASNAAIVPAGTSGSISIMVTNATDVIIDINGYFAPSTGSSLVFYPVTPCRVADTRLPPGTFGGPFLAGSTRRDFPIGGNACGAPATAKAYSLNVTVVPRVGFLGFLTGWPAGQAMPNVSILNSMDGSVKANAAIVPAGTNGAVTFSATNDTDLVLDINGYFAPPATGGLSFYAATPCRIADTRNAAGPLGGPILGSGETRSFPIQQSACGLPASAQAYSFNMTVAPAGFLGFLTVYPTGQTLPMVSTLNSLKGIVIANAAIVQAGVGGSVNVYAPNSTQVVIDTNGYFAP
jgi:Divergent InlB B-repeat domain